MDGARIDPTTEALKDCPGSLLGTSPGVLQSTLHKKVSQKLSLDMVPVSNIHANPASPLQALRPPLPGLAPANTNLPPCPGLSALRPRGFAPLFLQQEGCGVSWEM